MPIDITLERYLRMGSTECTPQRSSSRSIATRKGSGTTRATTSATSPTLWVARNGW